MSKPISLQPLPGSPPLRRWLQDHGGWLLFGAWLVSVVVGFWVFYGATLSGPSNGLTISPAPWEAWYREHQGLTAQASSQADAPLSVVLAPNDCPCLRADVPAWRARWSNQLRIVDLDPSSQAPELPDNVDLLVFDANGKLIADGTLLSPGLCGDATLIATMALQQIRLDPTQHLSWASTCPCRNASRTSRFST